MKDSTPAPNVTKIGSFTESKFGIASNDDLVYIFDILRNKLYSDKAMAVVREYCTNAADANTESGNGSRPIVITVPTKMSPVFKVRDFGFGLTEDQIRSVYCMYGRSTKRESNAYTGQLGLGSKSGFSYGDSFTVSSFKDGVKTVYSAYIDETRLGSVAKIHEELTKEENGIEISIPVKVNDVNVFAEKIGHVIRYFKTKPIINGSVDDNSNKAIYSGKKWRVCAKKRNEYQKYNANGGFNNAVAIMGNIGYPIDTNLVFPEIKDYWRGTSNEFKFLAGLVEIEFDIGELSIAASREELEYNTVTVNALKSAAKKYYSELINAINSEVSKAADGVQARIALSKIKDFTSYGHWGDIESTVYWRGKRLNGALVSINSPGIAVSSFYCSGTGSKAAKEESVGSVFVNSDTLDHDCLWLLDDNKNCNVKMQEMAKKKPGTRFYLFRVFQADISDGTTKHGDEWFHDNNFPKSYLKPISSYSYEKERKAVTGPIVRKSKGQITVYKLKKDVRHYGPQSENWDAVTVDASAIELYMEISKFKPLINGYERNVEIISRLAKALDHFKISRPEIYGVKTSDLAKVSEAKSIMDWLKVEAKNNATFMDMISKIASKKAVCDSDAWNSCPLLASCQGKIILPSSVSKQSVFARFVDAVSNYTSAAEAIPYQTVELINCICEFGKIDQNDYNKTAKQDLEILIKEFKKSYPLLKYSCSVSSSERNAAMLAVYDYVNKSGC